MNTKEYCSYKLVKLLTDKGFPMPVGQIYINKKNKITACDSFEFLEHYDDYIPTCTHQEVCSWLRTEKGITVSIIPTMIDQCTDVVYEANIWINETLVKYKYSFVGEYEECSEAAIEHIFTKMFVTNGWHPGTEIPPKPFGKITRENDTIVILTDPDERLGFRFYNGGKWNMENVKWWCFPPKMKMKK